MVTKEEFQGWILDYACYHRISPIINAISLRHAGRLDDLHVPHLRLACATIHFIIESEQLSQFDEAIKLVQQVNQAVPPLLVCQKTYMRLLTGLKIKALFQQLEEDTDRALVKLNTYFPRSTPKSTNVNQGQRPSKFNQNHKNFRCFFFSLVSNENQLRAYLKEDYNAEFGPKFMESIKKLCGRFLQQIESHLLPPMIEKVLACAECEKFSKISPATEMLLDFVQEKKLSSQSDISSQQHSVQQKGRSRASLVFTQQELFEMLTVSYPLYTQDWLARDHGLNLSSQDLFESFESQESLPQPYSEMNSPHVIISKSQESTSAPLVPLAGPQDKGMQQEQPPQQGSSDIQQTLQQQQVARHSLQTSQEEPPGVRQLAVVQHEVRQSPGENERQTPTIRNEAEQSKMGTETTQQCERNEHGREHAEAQPKAVDQSRMIPDQVQPSHRRSETGYKSQLIHSAVRPSKRVAETGHLSEMIPDEVQPSKRGPGTRQQSRYLTYSKTRSSKRIAEMGHQSEMIPDEVRPLKRVPETEHQSQMIEDEVQLLKRGAKTRPQSPMLQDEVRPSHMGLEMGYQCETMPDEIRPELELEELRLSQMAAHDNVQSQSFTRQEMVQENLLPQSEILERTFSQLPKDQELPIGSPQWEEPHPQQEEPYPQTLLQNTDSVHPNVSSSVDNLSPPLAQTTDPANIMSTPIHPQREVSPNVGQQEKDPDNQRNIPSLPTDLDPLTLESFTAPNYIRPWLAYEPRQPSYKLLRSKVFKSCTLADRNPQDAEMGLIENRPPDPSSVTLERNLPKHSSAAEEASGQSCPQSDKGSETLHSSWATSSSLRLSTDLSSISSGSCEIVSPSDADSAEVFFMGTPEETIDTNYNFISRHLLQDVKACIIKLYRNQQLDVVDEGPVFRIYS